jgi:membrane protein DedA with SNARE-associated domain
VFQIGEPVLRHLLSTYGYWAVFAFVGIESIGIPFPGETMLVVAGLYAGATHQISITLVIAAAAAGAIMGDNIGFLIGHFGGYPALLRYGKYVRMDQRKIKLARYLFLQHGGKVVFFGRFVAVLRTYAAFLAGTARMPWWRFLLYNATGGAVWSLVYGLGSYHAGARLEQLDRPLGFVLGVLALLAVAALAVFVRRNQRRLEEEAELALPGPLDPALENRGLRAAD